MLPGGSWHPVGLAAAAPPVAADPEPPQLALDALQQQAAFLRQLRESRTAGRLQQQPQQQQYAPVAQGAAAAPTFHQAAEPLRLAGLGSLYGPAVALNPHPDVSTRDSMGATALHRLT